MQSLADRMKQFYELPCRRQLIRRMPVIIRVDGQAFHTFTRQLDQPFDLNFISAMMLSAAGLARVMQGFKAAYVQSDEASFFLTDYDTHQTDAWFGYVQSKLETTAAAKMSVLFADKMALIIQKLSLPLPTFDARAFNIPREEVANYFLWRARDWERNSLNMYCRSFYSDKQLVGKGRDERHEMLHKVGKNWATDLSPQLRNGTWLRLKPGYSMLEPAHFSPSYAAIADYLQPVIDVDKQPLTRETSDGSSS